MLRSSNGQNATKLVCVAELTQLHVFQKRQRLLVLIFAIVFKFTHEQKIHLGLCPVVTCKGL